MIPSSFSLQPQRLQVVLLKFVVKIEYGGINFDLLQWSPPSSPQQQEGVTTLVQLPSLDDDRMEEISSILEECPPFGLSPLCLKGVTSSDEITSFSSGEEMFLPPIPHEDPDIRYSNDDPM